MVSLKGRFYLQSEGKKFWNRFTGRSLVALLFSTSFFAHAQVFASLPAPSGLAADSKSPGQVEVTWTYGSQGQTGFVLQISDVGGNKGFRLRAKLPGTQTVFKDSRVELGKTYFYRILAFNPSEKSVWSNEARVTVLAEEPPPPPPAVATNRRGLWVWTTDKVLNNVTERAQFDKHMVQYAFTDIYLYIPPANYYRPMEAKLRGFISDMNQLDIRVWALDGDRRYFSDMDGPAKMFRGIDELIAYNKRVAPNERFYGFQTDNEPHDKKGYPTTFHSRIADSDLSPTSGGLWKGSQKEDREMMMRDWLDTHNAIKQKFIGTGLKLGIAIADWIDYQGVKGGKREDVFVTWNGVRQSITRHFMNMVDAYVFMSYEVPIEDLVFLIKPEMTYAASLPANKRPEIHASMLTNTHQPPDPYSSYGDHATKNRKSVVLADMPKIRALLGSLSQYLSGIDIHDWYGWSKLTP